MTRLERLAAWALDPEYAEELLGDLQESRARRMERGGTRAARLRYAWDLTSACVLVSRARTAESRQAVPALAALALVLVLMARGLAFPEQPIPYTINAHDPFGRFTLDIRGTRVVGATLDGKPVPAGRLRQDGLRLVILNGAGVRDFQVTIKPEGGITWDARPAKEVSLP
ncbi:MAG TPA: hypothetical protein VGA42_02980 [Gemmatimonadales bacterium]|jgi:hypothetical protein